jgi:hypothetical protein
MPGKKRELLPRQARASEPYQIDRWITSPGLRPPE